MVTKPILRYESNMKHTISPFPSNAEFEIYPIDICYDTSTFVNPRYIRYKVKEKEKLLGIVTAWRPTEIEALNFTGCPVNTDLEITRFKTFDEAVDYLIENK